MNTKKSIVLLLTALTAFLIIACDTMKGEWAVKIDDDVISVEEFNRFYYTQIKALFNIEDKEEVDKMAANPQSMNPQYQKVFVKKNFLDQLIAQKLLYKKALSDKDIDQEELKTYIELAKMQAVATFYLGRKLKDQIEVSKEDINKFYMANRKYFAGRPIDDKVENQIKRTIIMQRTEAKSQEYIMNLVAESKVNKEGFKNYMKKIQKEKEEKAKAENAKEDAKKAEEKK